MADLRIEALTDLYRRAQGGSGEAWFRILDLSIPPMAKWLCLRWTRLSSWEAEEVSDEAFSRIPLKFESFPTWLQARSYARKVALSLAKRRLQGHRPEILSLSTLQEEPFDPCSDLVILEIDVEDLLGTLLKGVKKETTDLLLSEITNVINPQPVRKRAISLGISCRKLHRLKQLLRARIASWYVTHAE
jgi:hypothetical protein